jgi:predicted nucleic acid-binding protein
MILLDGNIVIGYLNGDPQIISTLDTLKRERRAMFVSSITVTETLSLSSITQEKLPVIERFLDGFIVVAADKEIAKAAAVLRRAYHLDVPDAFIAGTAYVQGIPLATRDRKMRKIPGIVLADV